MSDFISIKQIESKSLKSQVPLGMESRILHTFHDHRLAGHHGRDKTLGIITRLFH